MNKFPIEFKLMAGLSGHDDTDKFLESMIKITPMVQDIFKEIS